MPKVLISSMNIEIRTAPALQPGDMLLLLHASTHDDVRTSRTSPATPPIMARLNLRRTIQRPPSPSGPPPLHPPAALGGSPSLTDIVRALESNEDMALAMFHQWYQNRASGVAEHDDEFLSPLSSPQSLQDTSRLREVLFRKLKKYLHQHMRYLDSEPFWRLHPLDVLGLFGLNVCQSKRFLQDLRGLKDVCEDRTTAIKALHAARKHRMDGDVVVRSVGHKREFSPADVGEAVRSLKGCCDSPEPSDSGSTPNEENSVQQVGLGGDGGQKQQRQQERETNQGDSSPVSTSPPSPPIETGLGGAIPGCGQYDAPAPPPSPLPFPPTSSLASIDQSRSSSDDLTFRNQLKVTTPRRSCSSGWDDDDGLPDFDDSSFRLSNAARLSSPSPSPSSPASPRSPCDPAALSAADDRRQTLGNTSTAPIYSTPPLLLTTRVPPTGDDPATIVEEASHSAAMLAMKRASAASPSSASKRHRAQQELRTTRLPTAQDVKKWIETLGCSEDTIKVTIGASVEEHVEALQSQDQIIDPEVDPSPRAYCLVLCASTPDASSAPVNQPPAAIALLKLRTRQQFLYLPRHYRSDERNTYAQIVAAVTRTTGVPALAPATNEVLVEDDESPVDRRLLLFLARAGAAVFCTLHGRSLPRPFSDVWQFAFDVVLGTLVTDATPTSAAIFSSWPGQSAQDLIKEHTPSTASDHIHSLNDVAQSAKKAIDTCREAQRGYRLMREQGSTFVDMLEKVEASRETGITKRKEQLQITIPVLKTAVDGLRPLRNAYEDTWMRINQELESETRALGKLESQGLTNPANQHLRDALCRLIAGCSVQEQEFEQASKNLKENMARECKRLYEWFCNDDTDV